MAKNNKKCADFPNFGDFSNFYKIRSKWDIPIIDILSNVYEWSSNLEPSSDNLPLPFVSQNEEVIWSYLKHQNKHLEGFHRKNRGILNELIGKDFIAINEKKKVISNGDEEENDHFDEDNIEFDDEEDIEDEEEEEDVDLLNLRAEDLKDLERELEEMENEEDKNEKSDPTAKKYRKSVVDDEFFCLEEMHEYIKKAERNGGKVAEDLMFEDDDNWDGKTNYIYEDFFGVKEEIVGKKKRKVADDEEEEHKKAKKKVRFADEEEKEDEEEELEIEDEMDDEQENNIEEPVLLGANVEDEKEMSAYGKRQSLLKEKIAKLEEENLKPRTWELSGEVAAEQRETNTLLEQHVDFDHGTKRAPEVTEEFTDKIEEMIKQRIRDKTFDDVVRVKKIEQSGPKFESQALEDIYNKKTSLAEVYEKEYQHSIGAESGEKTAKNEAHELIKTKMSDLFKFIDSLTHFEYKPAEAREDVKIVSNMASLRVEEVGAMASSEAQLMAPEEVKKKVRGDVKGEEERDKTDKLRERRKKKSKQRAMVSKFGEDKVFSERKAEKLKKKNASENGNETTVKLKSSNFFSKLQDTVQQEKKAIAKKKVIKRLKTDKNSVAIKL